MDERVMKKCIGAPIPQWDMAHRLCVSKSMGPEIKDFGTVFCVNSTFMDVAEPSLLDRQWATLGVVMAFCCVGIGPYAYWLTNIRFPYAGGIVGNIFAAFISFVFGNIVFKLGRGLFFGLRYRPIRFHRGVRRLYSTRARRFWAKADEGDVVWECPWTEESIFCLHREPTPYGTKFHIRHYAVDAEGNVTRAFSIGREWDSSEVRLALAQWNYWCKYMNDGPSTLPKPMLFLTRNETPRESFLFSLYDFGMNAPLSMRLLAMPAVLIFTLMRMLANVTCRNPVWPEAVEKMSRVATNDPYLEPRAGTPVGWAETVMAQKRGEYPDDEHARVEGWTGEPDGEVHAAAWLNNPIAMAAR